MAGEFNAPVARQDPNVAIQEFSITCDKISTTDCEKNRFTLVGDFDGMKSLDWELKLQQHEVLPSIRTKLISIVYQIEALITHESMLGDGQEIPSIFFPITIARNPEGELDEGLDGSIAQFD